MSRSIDFSKPLSLEDHEYATQRPWLIRDAELAGYEITVEGDFESDKDEDETLPGYNDWNTTELKSEITSRNADRENENRIVVAAPGRKEQLVAALVADDESDEEDDSDEE